MLAPDPAPVPLRAPGGLLSASTDACAGSCSGTGSPPHKIHHRRLLGPAKLLRPSGTWSPDCPSRRRPQWFGPLSSQRTRRRTGVLLRGERTHPGCSRSCLGSAPSMDSCGRFAGRRKRRDEALDRRKDSGHQLTRIRPFARLDDRAAPGVSIGNVQFDKGPHNQPLNGLWPMSGFITRPSRRQILGSI